MVDFIINRYGLLTAIEESNGNLYIEYAGNMGANFDHVNVSLAHLGYVGVATLKSTNRVVREEGYPDYLYVLEIASY